MEMGGKCHGVRGSADSRTAPSEPTHAMIIDAGLSNALELDAHRSEPWRRGELRDCGFWGVNLFKDERSKLL